MVKSLQLMINDKISLNYTPTWIIEDVVKDQVYIFPLQYSLLKAFLNRKTNDKN